MFAKSYISDLCQSPKKSPENVPLITYYFDKRQIKFRMTAGRLSDWSLQSKSRNCQSQREKLKLSLEISFEIQIMKWNV